MKIAIVILTSCFAATIISLLYAVPIHLIDHSWPIHAQNHVLQSLIWIVGYSVIGIVIVLVPFKKGELWAWWALLVTGIFIYGGYFLAILITNGGAPGIRDDIFFGVILVAYLAALGNTRRLMR